MVSSVKARDYGEGRLVGFVWWAFEPAVAVPWGSRVQGVGFRV